MLKKTFTVLTPQDMLNKLEWELVGLRGSVGQGVDVVAYHAMNCAVTAWHIADWVFRCDDPLLRDRLNSFTGREIKTLSDLHAWLRDSSRDLALCQQLATASKHFELYPRMNDTSVATGVEVRSVPAADGSADVWAKMVIADGEKVLSPHDVFKQAFDFWAHTLQRVGLLHTPETQLLSRLAGVQSV